MGFHRRLLRYQPFDAAATDDEAKSVKLSWSEGDKTTVQIDMSTLQPDSTTFDTMSIYKYLLLLEKHKKVTAYDLSYTQCSRVSGSEGFNIAPKDLHVYKTMPDLTKALTCKSVFWDCALSVKKSHGLLDVFRYRFDRVNAVTKVQKPYVFSKVALSLEAGQPMEVA